MTTNNASIHLNTHQISKDSAKDFLLKFGFTDKLKEITDEKDNGYIYVLSANIAIFCTCLGIFFAGNNVVLTASLVLIGISAVLTLISSLLNLWYIFRLKRRTLFFKKEIHKIGMKTEDNIARIFEMSFHIVNYVINLKIKNIGVEEKNLINIQPDNPNLKEMLSGQITPICLMAIDLAMKETYLSIDKCYAEPLDEDFAETKLLIDRISDETKDWGLVLGAGFVLVAVLIKFIV